MEGLTGRLVVDALVRYLNFRSLHLHHRHGGSGCLPFNYLQL